MMFADPSPKLAAARTQCVELRVVAAKKPGEWIVRAFSPFTDWATLERHVQLIVGVIDTSLQWSHYRYEGWPHYVVYGKGDLERIGWPTGVYRFDHVAGDRYGPAVWLGDVR